MLLQHNIITSIQMNIIRAIFTKNRGPVAGVHITHVN